MIGIMQLGLFQDERQRKRTVCDFRRRDAHILSSNMRCSLHASSRLPAKATIAQLLGRCWTLDHAIDESCSHEAKCAVLPSSILILSVAQNLKRDCEPQLRGAFRADLIKKSRPNCCVLAFHIVRSGANCFGEFWHTCTHPCCY